MKASLIGAFLTLAGASAASAEVLAVCSAPKGQSFYLAPGQPRWTDDAITGGTVTFLTDESGFNIIIKDSTGVTFDMKGDGATIIPNGLDAKRGSFTLTAIYKLTPVVEVFQVAPTSDGKMKLIWNSTKNGSMEGRLTKASIFVADCS